LRFARLRLESRRNYLRKVAELATKLFISSGSKPNVKGLVLAGLADFKNDLMASDLFDARLKPIVLKIVDVSYGFENGFNQAIEMSAGALTGVKVLAEKKLIATFFSALDRDTGMVCYGMEECQSALSQHLVRTLIVWEELAIKRLVFRRRRSEMSKQSNDESSPDVFIRLVSSKTTTAAAVAEAVAAEGECDLVSECQWTEWLTDHYRELGCELEFVTDRTPEGSQFCLGFGGVACVLQYAVDPTMLAPEGGAREAFVPRTGGDDDAKENRERTVEEIEADFI